MLKIAVIGAGVSGLTVANQLKNYVDVTVFEKARGVGGRVSTRYSELFNFDHGAQFFKANSQAFKSFIEPLIQEGDVKEWHGRFVEISRKNILRTEFWNHNSPHYVGVPGMNAIAKQLSKGIHINLNTLVAQMEYNDAWKLVDDRGNVLGDFDWVIITAPVEQSLALLPFSFAHYEMISSIKMSACFSLMLGFDKPLPLDFDCALIRDANISWISVNSSKPGRHSNFCLLVHSTNDWANAHLDDDQEQVFEHLLSESSDVLGHDVSVASHKSLHRWRYANVDKQKGSKYFIDYKQNIAVCGDWCIKGRVESAFLSAWALSEEVVKNLL